MLFRSEEDNIEVTNLVEVLNIIRNEKSKISIFTDYQFISVALNLDDNSPNKYWYDYHVYPKNNHRLYGYYRNFFIEKLKKSKIKKIFVVKPIVGDDRIVENIFTNNCFQKLKRTEILDIYNLDECNEIK